MNPHQPEIGTDSGRSEQELKRRSQRLFSFGVTGLAIGLAYFAFTANVADPFHLYGGLLIMGLAVLPCLLWAKRGSHQLPVFEVQMLTAVNAFAIPLLNSGEKLAMYAGETIDTAMLAVLLYQGAAIGTHAVVGGRAGRTPFFTEEVLSSGIQKFISAGLVLSTVYTFLNVFYQGLIPYELNSIFRAAFAGIGLISTFVEMRRWGQGTLKPGEAGMIGTLVATQIIMQVSTLFLVGGITLLVLCIIGYVSGSRRIPVVPIAVALFVLGILHNGKSAMRDVYWDAETNERSQVELLDLPAFYVEWFSQGLRTHDAAGEEKVNSTLVDRTSLMHILCMIVNETPEMLPFLEGKTYAQIPGQFVPRFFWPGKPPGHISTNTLSIYYGLQDEDAATRTTIGFGFVAEAYANYGMFGVGLIGCLVGFFYKKIQVATAQCAMLSYAGLFLVVLMAWSFQTEFTMSIWLSSFYQACVAVMGIPFLVRNLFG
jgi:hypothetical protein